ncbi:hypothetical protein HJC23_004016 [Cyclotella cryptica]|uniref:GDP-D-glucose phosphorylase n=1 Tax=Cyclotella cryptica TaxID=29204 RepID=A0ABD3QUF5_9STRA|eukprot:CCRYP_002003-RA/>CCRYP_002003-RA protein AED:0.23 eAED:0.23 QI:0/-1/0/1/-1/1/1/0/550
MKRQHHSLRISPLAVFASIHAIPLSLIQSFSSSSLRNIQRRQLEEHRSFGLRLGDVPIAMTAPNPALESTDETREPGHGIPSYGMGRCNLSLKWSELVRSGEICATTILRQEDDSCATGITVRYGVRFDDELGLSEYVLLDDNLDAGSSKVRERVQSINSTLTEMQRRREFKRNQSEPAMQYVQDGEYIAQLQLIRTLRPPRSKNMDSYPNTSKVSCTPPPYDVSNSFLVGPLRLYGRGDFHGEGDPRLCVAKLSVPSFVSLTSDETIKSSVESQTFWDVYHNISPVDSRGHFLLLPTLQDRANWREQSLLDKDCYEMTYLASTIFPHGSLMLSFNSVGAGASQNHIHCHAWVCPPPPLISNEIDSNQNMHGYAATGAKSSSKQLTLPYGTTISLLEYPCTCIKLTIFIQETSEMSSSPGLEEIGKAIATIVRVARVLDVPYNVAWTNGPGESPNNDQTLTAFIFFRSKSQSIIRTGPSMINSNSSEADDLMRCGASEMLGLFHTSSRWQLDALSITKGTMETILRDVSWEPREMIWKMVCDQLKNLRNG